MQSQRIPPGLVARHSRSCRSRDGGACNCEPSFEAWVYSPRDQRKIRKTFSGKGAKSAAKSWRADAVSALDRGTLARPTRRTVRDVADEWLAGATSDPPIILTKSMAAYKPSALRGYSDDLRLYVLPALGHLRISDLRRSDVQTFIDRLVGVGCSPSKIHNIIVVLKVVCRYAMKNEWITVNPTVGLSVPADTSRRDRVASPGEAAQLLDALPVADRALWATALYAGLRLGELRALRWADVDLATGTIIIERAPDAKGGIVMTKTRAGRRRVPIACALRDHLLETKTRTVTADDDLVFPSPTGRPFTPSYVRRRAARAWRTAELEPIGFHECRHTFASLVIAAGVNAKALSEYLGHASIVITLDRYGHLMPGNESEAAAQLDTYLERADTAARLAQLAN
jgi:integrase